MTPWLVLLSTLGARASSKVISVMVFGDSYGDTGPTWHQVQDMFDARGVPAVVKSAAVGGTAACQWASNPDAMAEKARHLFPHLPDGPDFVWYTLGANDNWRDREFQSCLRAAKGQSWDAVLACLHPFNDRTSACTKALLANFWSEFPLSKVMHSGYDVPCDNLVCQTTSDAQFYSSYCGDFNLTCSSLLGTTWQELYLSGLSVAYPIPRYTALNMVGTVQKAAGIPGADTGAPVLDKGANCAWETLCVHPKYDTPAGRAWGEAFWQLFFRHHAINIM